MMQYKEEIINTVVEYYKVIIAILFIIGAFIIYKNYRRITSLEDLPRKVKGVSLNGIVTNVSDGDGFKMVHVPLLRSNKIDKKTKALTIRLAGIDAPEMAHFGIKAQPFSAEAMDRLRLLVLNKKVYITIQSVDMYNRIVAVVWVRKNIFWWTNVNIKMVVDGYACVYDRTGAEYGDLKEKLLEAESKAKKNKLGMWKNKNVVLPMDYKKQNKGKNTK